MELFRPVEGIELDQLGTVISDEPKHYPVPEQFGPLRWHDKEVRCASRGCASPTYLKVSRVPRCMVHALRELNEMLIELGEDQHGGQERKDQS